MLNNFALGQYIPLDSLIHKASPKIKIISIFLITLSIFLIKSNYLYFYLLIIALIILKLSQLKIIYLIKSLKPLIIIFIFTIFLNILFSEGDNILFELSIFKITMEGLVLSFRFFMKITLLLIFATLLTFTTSPIELAYGIEELLNPLSKLKFPVHEFSLMLTIALRFVPTLILEIEKIKRAQEARCADFSYGNIILRARNFVSILIPLFVISFKRADDLAIAMESRCYNDKIKRTRYKQRKDNIYDYLMFLIAILIIFPIIVDYITYLKVK